jgi:uncharacterized membrane protein
MKKIKTWLYLLAGIIGAMSFYFGEFILTSEKDKNLSGMCIGLGAAIFCLGIGQFILTAFVPKINNPEIQRRKNIEVGDERNIRIREKVGSVTLRIINYALSAIILCLGFMHNSLIPILLLASVFVLELVLVIFLSDYYSKQM